MGWPLKELDSWHALRGPYMAPSFSPTSWLEKLECPYLLWLKIGIVSPLLYLFPPLSTFFSFFFHLMSSFHKYLLRSYYVPNSLLSREDTRASQTNRGLLSYTLHSRGVRSDTNKWQNVFLILWAAPGSQVTFKKLSWVLGRSDIQRLEPYKGKKL